MVFMQVSCEFDCNVICYTDLGSWICTHARIGIYLKAFKFLLQHDAVVGRTHTGANEAPDVGIKENHRVV